MASNPREGVTREHWELASRDASLGVGHVWTEVGCPAYRTMNPADCTCRDAWTDVETRERGPRDRDNGYRGHIHPGPSTACMTCAARGRLTWLSEDGSCRREDAH